MIRSRMEVAGLGSAVVVGRDRYGVAHIQAQRAEDAFFAQGWVHAHDRFAQMDRDRRMAYGTLAAVEGPQALPGDILARRLRLSWVVRRDLAALRASTRTMLEAYARGVNAWLAREGTSRRPPAAPWEPWDSLAVFFRRHLSMGGWEVKLWHHHLVATFGAEAAARWLVPGGAPEAVILPPGEVAQPPAEAGTLALGLARQLEVLGGPGPEGSNSWVVAGSRTSSGLPLLAGDPHRPLEVPSVYYPNHLACPEFDAIGLSMPGVPAMPHFGHNREVAWGITHGMADTGDLYLERPEEREVTHRAEERIAVRGGDPVAVEVVWTPQGATVEVLPSGVGVTLRLPELVEENTTADAFWPMLQARRVEDLEESMRPWVAPVQNLVMADRQGSIAYRTRGRLPIRHPANAYLPVPGADPDYRWRGFVPFAEMPAQRGSATGWIVTANQRIAAEGYPHYISHWFAADHRARRIMALLGDRRGLTVADMEAIHGDILSLPAVAARPLWERITPRTAREARALSLLRGWDGRMEADRPEPLLYSAWREALVRRLLGGAAALPQDPSPLTVAAAPALAARWRGRVVALALAGDPRVVPPGPAGEDLLSEVFAEGMAELSRRLPGEPEGWRWGDLHRLAPGGSGGSPSEGPFGLALPGDPDTVRAAGYLPETGFAVESGSVARYAFDLGDWDASGWVIPHGVGGEPDHPHFADQVTAWRQARLLPMAYSPAAVATITVAQEELHPASPRAGPSRRT